jgi:hypothetical protein
MPPKFMVWNKLFGKSKFQTEPPSEENQNLIGRWMLRQVGGNQPPITMHVLHFKTGGTWESESILLNQGGGHFDIAGGGIWKINKGVLSFTAGENSGETEIKVEENFVTLGKDPILQLTEYPDKTCVYERTTESVVRKFADYIKDVGAKTSQAAETGESSK